jgi:hypothetical protein
MQISNFTDTCIRIGEYPLSVDITNIPDYHSNYGIMANFFLGITSAGTSEGNFMQIRRRTDIKISLVMVICGYDSQLEKLPDYVGEVLFDSRNFMESF